MKKFLLVLLILPYYFHAKAQSCDCKANLNKLIETTEEKYIGYRYKTKKKSYSKMKLELQKKLSHPGQDCSQILFSYLNFFQDKHIDFDETISLESHDLKSVNIDSVIVLLSRRKDNLEGYWATDNNAYVVGIIKTSFGYNGYLIHSGLKQYKPGDLKFQIFDVQKKTPAGISYEKNKNNVLKLFRQTEIAKNKIFIGLSTLKKIPFDSLEAYKKKNVVFPDFSFRFEQIRENLILKIPSFGASSSIKLDSILKANDSLIKNTKNFIIDIRRNFGGNIEASYALLDHIYTQPFVIPGACYLPTKESIESIERAATDTTGLYTHQERNEYKALVARLRAAKGNIICDTMRKTKPALVSKIKNVAIVTNRKTFSAAEIFLLIAKQSRLVTVFGESTGGMVDFGWSFAHNLPCGQYNFTLPVQTNSSYPKYSFDIRGIAPDIRLNSEEKYWIDDIINYYEKK